MRLLRCNNMPVTARIALFVAVLFSPSLWTGVCQAEEAPAGMIKHVKGQVQVVHGGQTQPATVNQVVYAADTVMTGNDGTVGITLQDGTLLSSGPNSKMLLQAFVYDPKTKNGQIDTQLMKGTLAVVSGKISKTNPNAVTYRTPNTILGVRGTEFVIEVADETAGR